MSSTCFRRAVGMIVGSVLMASASLPAIADQLDPVAEIQALLPEAIKSAGVLRIAMPDQGKPFAYQEDNVLKGMDLDLAKSMTEVMGLKAEITLIPFDAAISGLKANKFDISFGDFYITEERLKIVNFVTNWKTFGTYLVQAGSGFAPQQDSDLCGHKVAAMTGSTDLKALETANAACEGAGIEIEAFPGNTAITALLSGRVEAIRLDMGIAAEAKKTHSALENVGALEPNYCGTAIARNENAEGLGLAMEAALKHLIASGDYMKALKDNNLDYGAISADEVAIYTEESGPPSVK